MHKEWLEFAAMDLDSAQFLLGMRPVPVEIICYHCEQAADAPDVGRCGQRKDQTSKEDGGSGPLELPGFPIVKVCGA